jgi:hypothetical protein
LRIQKAFIEPIVHEQTGIETWSSINLLTQCTNECASMYASYNVVDLILDSMQRLLSQTLIKTSVLTKSSFIIPTWQPTSLYSEPHSSRSNRSFLLRGLIHSCSILDLSPGLRLLAGICSAQSFLYW